MVEEQQKPNFLQSVGYASNYGFRQGFSYQIVSLAVTESREVTKKSVKALHCVDCHYFA